MTEPTSTERLRAMLDERGVEWRERKWGGKHSVTTFWRARGVRWHYRENRFGEVRLHADDLAPEQAIAATLGDTDATEERQHVASDDLIGLWREWEPVLFANVQDEVAQDNLNECVHALLDKAATAGAGMCHMEQTGHVKVAGVDYYDDDYECSECGAELFEGYNYCPNCGRRVVKVDE